MEDLEMIYGLMFEIVLTVVEVVHLKLSIIGLATSGKTCARTYQEIAGLNPRSIEGLADIGPGCAGTAVRDEDGCVDDVDPLDREMLSTSVGRVLQGIFAQIAIVHAHHFVVSSWPQEWLGTNIEMMPSVQ